MSKLFKTLKNHKIAVLLIVLLLVIKAFCELSLPAYTSDIVDVGIQQGGIENSVMEQMRSSTYDKIMIFLNDEDAKIMAGAYKEHSDGTYHLIEDSEEGIAKLDGIMGVPEMIITYAEKEDPDAISKIAAAYEAGIMSQDQIMDMKDQATDKMGSMSDSIISQVAVTFVGSEYKAMNLDTDDIQMSYLKRTGVKMLLITLVMIAAGIAICYISSKVAARIGWNLRNQLFTKVVSFSSNEIDKFSTASLITRSTNDIQQIQMVMVMLLRMILYAPIIGVGGIIKVVSTKTGLGWVIFLAVAVAMVVVGVLMLLAMPRFKKMQTLIDRVNLVSREILTGLPVIRAFGREHHEEGRFDGANKDLTSNQLFVSRTMTFMFPMMMLVMNGVSVLIVWFGAKGVDAGNLQVGDMMAFLTYAILIIMAFLMISMISIMLPRAIVSAERIDEVLSTELTIHDKTDNKDVQLDKCRGELEFNNVSFRYPGADDDVVKNISFRVLPGTTTAIIGSTGCGKSTLVHLIMRFYDVTDGSITLDGIDIRDLSQHKLRSEIGFVPQKGVLFSGTIESNIKYGADEIDHDAVQEAAVIAQAENFIMDKDDTYNSPIAQGGSNVSGGQKQRLSIARAVAVKPKLFLFDDSFSALDYKTDVALRKALSQKTADAAVLIVAQRISTIMHAEQIIVLDDGKIAGIGTHEELMNNCAEYIELAKSQLSSEELEGGPSNGR